MNTHKDFVWEEAEKLMRDNGRKVLGCGSRVSNEAVMGELGWVSMLGRRMLLRLSFWGKILSMGKDRLVRRMYEAGRARLDVDRTDGHTDTHAHCMQKCR